MRRNNWLKTGAFALLSALFLFNTACKKDDEPTGATDSQLTEVSNDGSVELFFDEVDDLALSGLNHAANMGGRMEEDTRFACATVTADTIRNTNGLVTQLIVLIDFGTGCEGPKGRVRAGKVKVTHNGLFILPGNSITIELTDFSVDGFMIEGTRTLTNETTQGTAGKIVVGIAISGGKVTWPDGTFATREITGTKTFVIDFAAPQNGEVWVEGSASGTNRYGKNYSATITEKLVFKRTCWNQQAFFPASGVKEISTDDVIVTVNFGDGACDNTATVTVDGVSKEHTLTMGN